MTTFPVLYKQTVEPAPPPRKTFRLRLYDAERKSREEELDKQLRSSTNIHEEHSVFFDFDEHDGHWTRCGTMPISPMRPWTVKDPALFRSTKSSPDLHHTHQKDLMWVDPIRAWIPVTPKSKYYQSFVNTPTLRNKSKYEFLDPCPHIHPCVHSKSGLMIQAEKDRLQAMDDFKQQKKLQRHLERMKKFEGDWDKFTKFASEHHKSVDNRLTAFRKTKEHYTNPMEGVRKQREIERQKEKERKQEIEKELEIQRLEEERLRLPEILITQYEEELLSMYSQDDIRSACSDVDSEYCAFAVNQTVENAHSLPASEHGSVKGIAEHFNNDHRVCAHVLHDAEVASFGEKVERYLEVLDSEQRVDSSSQMLHQMHPENSLLNANQENNSLFQENPSITMADEIPENLMGLLVPVPLGVGSKQIVDASITASSSYNQFHSPAQGRLNNERDGNNAGAWRPKMNNIKQYLQIDLGRVTNVKQVATQGMTLIAGQQKKKSFVKSYTLAYSVDGKIWQEYKEKGNVRVFDGNSDTETVVLNSLEEPVDAQLIRFIPKSWKTNITLRVEIYGNEKEPDVEAEEEERPSSNQQDIEPTSEAQENRGSSPILVEAQVQEIGESTLFEEENKQLRIIDEFDENSTCLINREPEPSPPNVKQQVDPSPPQTPLKEEEHTIKKRRKKMKKKKTVVIKEEPDSVFEYPPISASPEPVPPLVPESPQIPIIPLLPIIPPIPAFQEPDRPMSKKSSRKNLMFSSRPETPVKEDEKKPLPKAVAGNRMQEELRRQRLAEERRKKLLQMAGKKKEITRTSSELQITSDKSSSLDEFMNKYCILDDNNVHYFKRLFDLFDEDQDGFLYPDEVLEALEHVNRDLLSDSHLTYVYRILDLCDCSFESGADFKLFSVVAAFSQKIAHLDDYMKLLISKMDFKELDFNLQNAKSLFMCYADPDTKKLSIETLMLELMAGRINSKYTVELTLKLGGKTSLDFLDFLTYIPLFLHIHKNVLENPL